MYASCKDQLSPVVVGTNTKLIGGKHKRDVEVLVYLGNLARPNSAVTPELMQALKQ